MYFEIFIIIMINDIVIIFIFQKVFMSEKYRCAVCDNGKCMGLFIPKQTSLNFDSMKSFQYYSNLTVLVPGQQW